jgi:hypothetical protein
MKYRIVKRARGSRKPWYIAQRKIFGIWVDLRFHPFANVFDSYDMSLNVVERWMENYLKSKIKVNEPFTEEVEKTYD